MTKPEPEITIARRPALVALGIAVVACALVAWGVAQFMADPSRMAGGALAGVAVVGVLFFGGALLVASGKPRSVTLLPAVWMGATVGRVMGLLFVGFPIYFAAPQILPPFAVGAGGAYLVCLVVETAVIARQALR
ncbi:MAG: hypothetical protein JNK53_02540 [Phycisphaerae bacterium]|nr:hypothetical protein [Phycisphaerae bacterium]